MNIVLVGALNYCASDDRYLPAMPLGILSCAALLEEEGLHVHVLDPNLLVAGAGEDLYEILAEEILRHHPRLAGFSTYSTTYHQSLRIARLVKARDRSMTLVFGGPQASAVDEATIRRFPFVDAVVRGEGEYTLSSLVRRLDKEESLEGLAGITYRRGEEVVRAPDAPLIRNLDDLPMPAYHLYPASQAAAVPLDVGRGCPFTCTFCSTSGFWRRRYRLKSTKRMIAEIKVIRERLGATFFEIPHDLFTFDRKKVMQFCQALRDEELDLHWSCFGRIDRVDEELLETMAKSGCISIGYGVETGSPAMQQAIEKKLSPGEAEKMISLSLKAGMQVVSSYIVGFPDEREEDLDQTVALIARTFREGRRSIAIGCSLLIPYAGSELYHQYRDSLVYNGYLPVARPGSPYDRENIELIMKYPEIFPDYYHYPMTCLKRPALAELVDFLVLPMTVAPATLLALLEEKEELMPLFRRWQAFNASLPLEARYVPDPLRGDSHRFFANHFSRFITHLCACGACSSPFIADLADFETALYLHRLGPGRKSPPGAHDPAMAALCYDKKSFHAMKPAQEGSVAERTYGYNVKDLAEKILAGTWPQEVEPEKCTCLIWQSFPGVVDSLVAGELQLEALHHCGKGHTVAEIERAILGKMSPAVCNDETADTFRDLFTRGLVTFEPAGESSPSQLVQEPVEREEHGEYDKADDAPGEDDEKRFHEDSQ